MRTLIAIVGLLALLALLVAQYPADPVQAQAAAGFNYLPITAATNNQAKSAPGIFHNLTINGGTLTGVITVVDTSAANCSGGTTIGTIAQPQVAGQNYQYDLQFVNGLCITSAAAVNATATYR